MNTTETIDAVALANWAHALSTQAGELWGTLEAAEMQAASNWDAAARAFRTLGDTEAADAARQMARWHGRTVDRLRVAFQKFKTNSPNG